MHEQRQDTVISKERLSKQLVQLRDSVDLSILDLQKKLEDKTGGSEQKLEKAYNDLSLQRTEIENIIEEVVSANEQTWNDIKRKVFVQTTMKRKEYYQILNDVKDIARSESYH
jgi:hypothetical protein